MESSESKFKPVNCFYIGRREELEAGSKYLICFGNLFFKSLRGRALLFLG